MPAADLILEAPWVVPVQPAGEALENACVVVRAGVIAGLLPAADAAQKHPHVRRLRLPRHIVMPGLVNAHTHAALALFRDLAGPRADGQPLDDGAWPALARPADPGFVRDAADYAIAAMLRAGVVCFNDMYFFPESLVQSALHAGIRAVVGLPVIDAPNPWSQNAADAITQGLRLRDQYKDDGLIGFSLAPHSPEALSDAALKKTRTLADELNTPLQTHLHETPPESAPGGARRRPLERLEALGFLAPSFVALHAEHLDDDELAALARRRCHVVRCPRSSALLSRGGVPAARLLDAGVNLALGSNAGTHLNGFDLFTEMKLLALPAPDAGGLPAAAALEAATLGGARALGLDSEIGSLKRGKSADLIALDCGPDAANLSADNVIDYIVHTAERTQVCDVWIGGQHVLESRALAHLDETALARRIAARRQAVGGKPRAPGPDGAAGKGGTS